VIEAPNTRTMSKAQSNTAINRAKEFMDMYLDDEIDVIWSSAGGFEPLSKLKHQKIVLGLVSSKTKDLESINEIVSRIKDACEYVDISQICISPQCGFSSTEEGNSITEDDQWNKVTLVVELASKLL